MKRSIALIISMIMIVPGCGWPFGEALETVAFTILESSGGDFDATVPEAKIVNIGEQAIDILIVGEALINGSSSPLVNKVKVGRDEIEVILDWEKNSKTFSPLVHKLIRFEKGDWWPSGHIPRVHLKNVNGGSLNATAKPQQVRQVVFEHLPELTDEQVYLKFSFEDVTSSNPNGVWDITVVGSSHEGKEKSLDIVAKLKVNDQDLDVLSGKITYHSPNNGTIVNVEELP